MSNLIEAFKLLQIRPLRLYDEQRNIVDTVSFEEQVQTIFHYLYLLGYLTPGLFGTAIEYLDAAKPFYDSKGVQLPREKIVKDLNDIFRSSHEEKQFNPIVFVRGLVQLDYFSIDDWIDWVTFLRQYAFDRKYNVERDKLLPSAQLEQHVKQLGERAKKLGIITPCPPAHQSYDAIGIMGASSPRVTGRIEYFQTLPVQCEKVFALSGFRELSVGLDTKEVMHAVAAVVEPGKTFQLETRGSGSTERRFLSGITVTETMMVHHRLATLCPGKNIAIIDSPAAQDHWRATTKQNGKDIAKIIVDQLVEQGGGNYSLMIIAEQPYPMRMELEVRQAIEEEISARHLPAAVALSVTVEGVGKGVLPEELLDIKRMTEICSEFGATSGAQFSYARAELKKVYPSATFRDPQAILFRTREEWFAHQEQVQPTGGACAPVLQPTF